MQSLCPPACSRGDLARLNLPSEGRESSSDGTGQVVTVQVDHLGDVSLGLVHIRPGVRPHRPTITIRSVTYTYIDR